MENEKHYYTELHATEIKDSAKHYATESVCAHFSTPAKVGTITFERAKMDAVDYYWNQQRRGWVDYTVGKTFVQTGEEPVSVMSPAWEYRTPTSMNNPVYEEVK